MEKNLKQGLYKAPLKLCRKCNRIYGVEMTYCPECGEKLLQIYDTEEGQDV